MTREWNRALEGIEQQLQAQGISQEDYGTFLYVYDECVHELVDPWDPRIRHARAREYLRRRARERRERVRRVVLTLAPIGAFLLMFWRV